MKLNLKIYRGYANEKELVVFGHVFRKHSPDDYRLDARWYKHAWSVFRMFMIKTLPGAEVEISFKGLLFKAKTDKNGFFQAKIPYDYNLKQDWYTFSVSFPGYAEKVTQKAEFLKPHSNGYAIVSDIDDTFLVSHSANIFKKLYILMTKNVHKRHIFQEVVEHYRFLNELGNKGDETGNAFFYVSSSEWNLYNFIYRFTILHQFPKAVLLLNTIKSGLRDFLLTGGGNHNHKYEKIKGLIGFYPAMQFILLGDDSQRDPMIYQKICQQFPEKIKAIYIRQTGKYPKAEISKIIAEIDVTKIKACYFDKSPEAFAHSRENLTKKNPGKNPD
jgi:phosphatidate phosphatase APP1